MILEKKFVSIGGGIGSFCFIDTLKIHGIKSFDLAVLSKNKLPYTQFKKYCENSGLSLEDRLRSDSGARPDNFWGTPGYALSEILDELKHGNFKTAFKIYWQIFSEPIGADFYTPTCKMVYDSLKKESQRIDWQELVIKGKVKAIRKLKDGRFAIYYQTKKAGENDIVIANFIHLSVGHNHKSQSELGDWVYQNNPDYYEKIRGRILVLGRGIAAGKMVEKMLKNQNEVVSFFRSGENNSPDPRGLIQQKASGWRLQYFNFPRASFGGVLINKNYSDWSQATTPPTKAWLNLIGQAALTNFYKVTLNKISADYIINCSGFDDRVIHNNLYSDLLNTYQLPITKNGGFKTNEYFEIQNLSSPNGCIFVTGVGAAGNSYGPVDSFMGQQYAALKIAERLDFKLNPAQSFLHWLKWLTNSKI